MAGLFTASITSFIYALLGTCRQGVVGPEAALSLIIGQTIAAVEAALPHHPTPEELLAIGQAVASAITFLAGLFTFLLGIFRLGFLDAVLSRALLRGFITAVVRLYIFITRDWSSLSNKP